MNGTQKPERKRREISAIDDRHIRLYGRSPLREGGYKPTLRLKPDDNKPTIEVDLGYKNEKNYAQKIEVPLEPTSFETLLLLIERIAKSSQACSFEITSRGYAWVYDRELRKNVKSQEVSDLARIQVGRREDGVVYIAVASRGKDPVEFEFSPTESFPVTTNGQPVPLTITSPTAALAWVNIVREVYLHHFTALWQEPEWEKKRRLERIEKAKGGGSGGYGGGQNSYGGGQRQSAPQPAPSQGGGDDFGFDEDIPF